MKILHTVLKYKINCTFFGQIYTATLQCNDAWSKMIVRVIKGWDDISVEPGGCPTSGSTSAGRRRVGPAALIPSSEHFWTFSNQSLNGNCTCPKYSTTIHQLIINMPTCCQLLPRWAKMTSKPHQYSVLPSWQPRNQSLQCLQMPNSGRHSWKCFSFIITPWYRYSVSMINFTPIYTCVSLLQNQDRYTQDRLIEDEECHEPEPLVKCAVCLCRIGAQRCNEAEVPSIPFTKLDPARDIDPPNWEQPYWWGKRETCSPELYFLLIESWLFLESFNSVDFTESSSMTALVVICGMRVTCFTSGAGESDFKLGKL